jgi:hypothetical protein
LSLFVRLRFSGGGGETHSSGQEGLALALQVKIFTPDLLNTALKTQCHEVLCFRFFPRVSSSHQPLIIPIALIF